jgi:hypothetical protein
MKRISLLLSLLFVFFPVKLNAAGGGSSARLEVLLDGADHAPEPELRSGLVFFTREEIDALIIARAGRPLTLPSLERFTESPQGSLPFKRARLFASGARISAIGANGPTELSVDERQIYLAMNRTTSVGLTVDPVSGNVTGFIGRGHHRMQIGGNLVSGLLIEAVVEHEAAENSCSTTLSEQPIELRQQVTVDEFRSVSAAESGTVVSYEAIVAIETDTEWLDGFNDDTSAALGWITDLFLAMNVFYERDVETRLLIGDVILRTDNDAYAVTGDRGGQLDEFGAYWKDNMGHVERQFAAMFSGRDISSYGFSGIAWLDQFCGYGRTWGSRTVGSFSFNAIGNGRTPGNTALYVGHELGHNMGSPHTHCYDPPVDGCYNAEGSGCYAGNPVCPADGRGTIMSYCHVGGTNGAGCGTSKSEFHPTVQALLQNNLADELAAGCILPHVEQAPEPRFASSPAAGSSIDLGSHLVGERSDAADILVENLGDAELTLACALSGTHTDSFEIVACPATIASSLASNVTIRCTPLAEGNLSATLEMSSNDAEEPSPTYALYCSGTGPARPEVIFSSGFESP